MKKSSLGTLAALLAWVIGPGLTGAARAHHSFIQYDNSKMLTLKGTVTAFEWINPHVVLRVLVPSERGEPQQWAVEATSPGVLARGGWTRDTIKVGDRVSIDFHPLRDGSRGGGLDSVTLDTGQKLFANFAAQDKPNVR